MAAIAEIASNPSTAITEPTTILISELSSLVVLGVVFVVPALLSTTSSMVMAWSVPTTLQVYVPLSDGSGLEIVNVDNRDRTSTKLPFTAESGDPFVNVI